MLGFVAVMNVINFIDGVDGLAAGVCVISAATLSIIALSLDRPGAGGAGRAHRRRGARLPAARLPARLELHGGHRLQPARLPARRDRGPGRAEDERRRRPVLPVDRARGADPRHGLRGREADQVPAPDLPGRSLALPPPDGEHRLLAAPDARSTSTAGRWCWRAWRWRCASSPTATTTATSTRSGRWSWSSAASRRSPPASTCSSRSRSSSSGVSRFRELVGRGRARRRPRGRSTRGRRGARDRQLPDVDPETGEFEAVGRDTTGEYEAAAEARELQRDRSDVPVRQALTDSAATPVLDIFGCAARHRHQPGLRGYLFLRSQSRCPVPIACSPDDREPRLEGRMRAIGRKPAASAR